MNHSDDPLLPLEDCVLDHRLDHAYDEARNLDASGLEAICPSYFEITESGTRYLHQELIGRGATKEVFRAYDTRMKRWIALAVVRPDCGPETYDQFIHEVWLTSSLSHPNIIGIHDLGLSDDGRPFFTMDLKGATTLADVVASDLPQPLPDRLGILVKVCDAVAYAHSRHILHLDLKPENIQADAFGEVLVCDWGLGRIMADAENERFNESLPSPDGLALGEQHDNESLTGEIRGSLGYMAPEQVVPGAPKDQRTDVFALGCLLHTILTGAPPVTGGDRDDQLTRTREANFPPPRTASSRAALPPGLEAIFRKATALEPDDRYPTALEFGHDLTAYLSGYATEAEQAGFVRESVLFLRRHRVSASISLAGLVAGTVVGVLALQRLDFHQRLQHEARARAKVLTARTRELESLYHQQAEDTKRQAKELAAGYARSANTLKNLGIFSDPVKSIEEARQLASMALTLDPDCDAARLEMMDLYCHQLDFRSALSAPPVAGDNPFADYLRIARVAPGFAFTRSQRPEPRQLADFLREANKVNPGRAPLMERIVSYDYAARSNHSGYQQVVSALLAYINSGWSEEAMNHDARTAALVVRAKGVFHLKVPTGGGSGTCLLRFIPVRALTLEISGPVDLAALDGMLIESLDLRACPAIRFGRPTRLPLLQTLHVKQGRFSPREIQSWLVTAGTVKIVEHP